MTAQIAGGYMCGPKLKVVGHMCGPRIYEFEGWLFEYGYHGPWPLKKDFELRKCAGRKFWKMYDKFSDQSKEEQRKYRVGGGCVPIAETTKEGER